MTIIDDKPSTLNQQYSASKALDSEQEAELRRKVLRKTDLHVLPWLCALFFLQYLDKQILSYGAIFGLREDLHFKGQDFSTATTLFYVGQLVFEWPAMWAVHRFSVVKFTAISCVAWGGVLMTAAGAHNFAGIAAQRFFLGAAEAVVSPAFVLLTSFWYKQEEHALRTSIWTSMNLLAQILGALLTYGLGSAGSSASIAPWRLLFLVCGGLTIVVGVAFFFFFPTSPTEARFFSELEKEVAIKRLTEKATTQEHSQLDRSQIIDTLRDVKYWSIFALALGACVPSFVITFQSILIKEMGYTNFEAILWGLPAPAIQLGVLWLSVLFIALLPNARCLTGMAIMVVPLTGNIINLILPVTKQHRRARLVATWLASVLTPVMNITLSLVASNFLGHTRKTLTSFTYFIGYCVGLIVGPQFWLSKQAPQYRLGLIMDIIFLGIGILGFFTLFVAFRSQNKRRDRMASEGHEEYEPRSNAIEVNSSDNAVLGFRYAY
ncbi:pantothenate transporter [Violaceomyces palustris]|uniref:Pantothenate transporter n=1 Tax=Violaceomyces palustris TaxID=1673888 RepID=A0ACD0P461_9BASI|nr:pantothenate transporter [Violaceomyces palustris]